MLFRHSMSVAMHKNKYFMMSCCMVLPYLPYCRLTGLPLSPWSWCKPRPRASPAWPGGSPLLMAPGRYEREQARYITTEEIYYNRRDILQQARYISTGEIHYNRRDTLQQARYITTCEIHYNM